MSRILRALQRAKEKGAPTSASPAKGGAAKEATHSEGGVCASTPAGGAASENVVVSRILKLAGDLRGIMKDRNRRNGRAEKIALGLIDAGQELRAESALTSEIRELMFDVIHRALARAMPYLKQEVAFRVYFYLRSRVGKKRFKHGAMFAEMPKSVNRLHLLNFLYKNGERPAEEFVARFGRYFSGGGKLRYNERNGLFELGESSP